ncbi:MAG TPA: hypothetical protein VFD60_05745 [Nitrososphaeraceae archaeon]|nr:hypothetical protein [Nitrososphaeraceae archaeon]
MTLSLSVLLSSFKIMIMMPVYSEDMAPIAYAGSLNDSQTVELQEIILLWMQGRVIIIVLEIT